MIHLMDNLLLVGPNIHGCRDSVNFLSLNICHVYRDSQLDEITTHARGIEIAADWLIQYGALYCSEYGAVDPSNEWSGIVVHITDPLALNPAPGDEPSVLESEQW